MMDNMTVTATATLSPTQIAEAFWSMDDSEQADFFAALDDIAGVRLCFQMAYCVNEIQNRVEAGDYRAMHGFQTMLGHAQDMVNRFTERRVTAARCEIALKGKAARETK